MPANKIKEFLDSQQVKYVTISHSATYTAQEVAASAHVRGKDLAKTVMVTLDGKMAMAVLPASRKIDFDLLRQAAGVEDAQLAGERAFSDIFPGCEVGAMPPFGNLYGMDVYVSPLLAKMKRSPSTPAATPSWSAWPTRTSCGWSSRRSCGSFSANRRLECGGLPFGKSYT